MVVVVRVLESRELRPVHNVPLASLNVIQEVGDDARAFVVMSTAKPRDILTGNVFDLELPPPFNSVYPCPFYIAKRMESGAFQDTCVEEIHDLCKRHVHNVITFKNVLNVYDVPLKLCDDAVSDNEPFSDNELTDDELATSSEVSEHDDDADGWEDDEDAAS